MAKRNKVQKRRKRKELQRRRRAALQELRPYYGNKYKKEKYILAMMEAETGIYETYVMTDRKLTDRDVEAGLKRLIRELRSGPYQPAEERDEVEVKPGGEIELLHWNIKRNWDDLFTKQPRHSNAELAGILRTILASIETWSTPSPNSRGYLNYIEGFLTKAGVRVERIYPEDEEWEEGEMSDEEYLLDLGLEWLDTRDETVKREFFEEAEAMLDEGQAEEVINVCQYLIGQVNEQGFIEELVPLLQPAYHQLGVPFRSELPPNF